MIRFCAAHPTFANLLMVGFLAIGFASIPHLQRETFPRISPSKIQVSVAYPGARPEDVEEAVCRRLEDAIDAVDNVYEVTCEARESSAITVAQMNEGANLDRFFSDIKTEIDAIDDFPDEVEDPILKQLGRTDAVASVAITGATNLSDLKAYAEQVKTRMRQWGGIPKIEVAGFSQHQLRIEIPDATLRQFGLSLADIAAAISRQSVDLPSGSVKTADGEILIRFADERRNPEELGELIVVSSADGGQIRLNDIATITDRFEDDEDKVLFDGKPAALLKITKTENDDTLRVIGHVKAFLEHERARAPPNVKLVIVNDASSIVQDRLNLLLENGAQGLVLVFLSMWLFFGLRYSFWITMGLPVAFMGAMAVLVVLGYSINMLTMVGLLIVVGLLMDDAIVISENIATKSVQGLAPLDAAVEGASQVLPGVLASFATTVCIFGSLSFLSGDIGQLLRVIPVVMIAVLVVSLIEAFLILPNHLSHTLHANHSAGSNGIGFQKRIENTINWFADTYILPAARTTVRWRYLTTGCALMLLFFAVAAMVGGVLKFAAFPDLDGDTIEARILLPQGTPLARTEQVVARLEGVLHDMNKKYTPNQPDGAPLIENITIKFNENPDAYETGPHVATVSADLLSSETRTLDNDTFVAQWREGVGVIPDVIALKFAEPSLGPAGRAIDIRLQGNDFEALKKASLDMQRWLRRYDGANDVNDDLRLGKPEVRVQMKESGTALGLTAQDVADQLRKAYFGTTVSEIQVGVESYEIDARLALSDRDSLADLDDFTINAGNGHLVPLTAAATLEFDRGIARINRIDGVRTVSVQGDVDTRFANANEIINDTRKRFLPDFLERHPSVSVAFQGQDKELGKTQASMISGFLLGLLGVFLLLSFQFRSYVEPITVMVVIPLAFIGAVFGHILLGLDFSMPSLLGFVALSGVVVNDSILLVNHIKNNHSPDVTVVELAPHAVRARFRAIFLTSITTILGLLPLLSETSLQAQVLVPLVCSLAFGLMASTVLVLFVVPAIYSILDDFGLSTLAARYEDDEDAHAHV